MRKAFWIAVLAAALATAGLPACGRKATPEPPGDASFGPRLVGTWVSEPIAEKEGSVVTTFTFKEDGSFVVVYDREGADRDRNKKGTWSAKGDVLSLHAAGGMPDTLTIASLEGDVLALASPHGSAGRFTRKR